MQNVQTPVIEPHSGLPAETIESLLHQGEVYRKTHVASIYRSRTPLDPREGWALQSPYMMTCAPGLAYCRGDGWWTIEQACLYPTEEMAQAYADSHRGEKPKVVFVSGTTVTERNTMSDKR